MPINARLARLERSVAERAAAPSRDQTAEERFMRLVMSDPEAHGLFAQIVDLTPDAFGNPSFDFVKAARERPGLAEAAADLGRRVGLMS